MSSVLRRWWMIPLTCAVALGTMLLIRHRDGSATNQVILETSSQEVPIKHIQDTVTSCSRCAVAFTLIERHGEIDDPILLRGLPDLARSSDGTTYAYEPDMSDVEVIVYREGVEPTTLGRLGNGPGEYEYVRGIGIGLGDTVFVVHDAGRISVFSPDGDYVSSVRLPMPLSGGIIPHFSSVDQVLVVGGATTRDLAGIPYHIASRDGKEITSFGDVGIHWRAGIPKRVIAQGLGGGFWGAEEQNYRIERVAESGRVSFAVVVTPPASWLANSFTSRAQYDSITKNRPRVNITDQLTARPENLPIAPFFEMAGFHQSDDGLLWVAAHVAAPGWQEVELTWAEMRIGDEDRERLYRTIVDVIDPTTGVLLARGEMDGYGQMLNDGTFARPFFRPNGVASVEIYDVEFRRPDNRMDDRK